MAGATFSQATDASSIFKANNEFRNGFALEDIVKSVLAALQSEPPEPEEPDALVPETAIKAYKEFEDYPDILRAKHVRAILDISEAKAYEVLNSQKCPSFTIGKCKRVRKEEFIKYVIANEGQDLID